MAHESRTPAMTAEELFIASADSDKCELVDGALVRMPPTGGVHGKVAVRIGRLLDEYVEAHDLGVVCGAETGFILWRDPDVVRVPDVSFVATARIPVTGAPDAYWSLAPDLAVEVISPTDRQTDVQQKVADYVAAGTRLVWVVDPATRTVCVHRSAADVCTLADDAVLTGNGVLPEFSWPSVDQGRSRARRPARKRQRPARHRRGAPAFIWLSGSGPRECAAGPAPCR